MSSTKIRAETCFSSALVLLRIWLSTSQFKLGAKELALRGAEPSAVEPGWYAVSVNLLRGYAIAIPDGEGGFVYASPTRYTYFRQFQPVAMAGYSIYIYHLDQGDIDVLGRTSLR